MSRAQHKLCKSYACLRTPTVRLAVSPTHDARAHAHTHTARKAYEVTGIIATMGQFRRSASSRHRARTSLHRSCRNRIPIQWQKICQRHGRVPPSILKGHVNGEGKQHRCAFCLIFGAKYTLKLALRFLQTAVEYWCRAPDLHARLGGRAAGSLCERWASSAPCTHSCTAANKGSARGTCSTANSFSDRPTLLKDAFCKCGIWPASLEQVPTGAVMFVAPAARQCAGSGVQCNMLQHKRT